MPVGNHTVWKCGASELSPEWCQIFCHMLSFTGWSLLPISLLLQPVIQNLEKKICNPFSRGLHWDRSQESQNCLTGSFYAGWKTIMDINPVLCNDPKPEAPQCNQKGTGSLGHNYLKSIGEQQDALSLLWLPILHLRENPQDAYNFLKGRRRARGTNFWGFMWSWWVIQDKVARWEFLSKSSHYLSYYENKIILQNFLQDNLLIHRLVSESGLCV